MDTNADRDDKVQVWINVYDLLPPGRLSNLLWTMGGSILHSGVVIGDREYAFGAHGQSGLSGVYWTTPRLEPPGGTFRCAIFQGYATQSRGQIGVILQEVSHQYQGPHWNLLSNNCNHFASALCLKLTGKQTPSWINRAASIGVALPCVVPQAWVTVTAPTADDADGDLVEADEETEATGLLRSQPEEGDTHTDVEDDSDRDDGPYHEGCKPHNIERLADRRDASLADSKIRSKIKAVSNQESLTTSAET